MRGHVNRRDLGKIVAGGAFAVAESATQVQAAVANGDPLPSWNEGKTKSRLIDFVNRVTEAGGSDFIPAELRIATFDNDGTLWAEQPIYFQFAFAIDEAKRLALQHPEWKTTQPFKALLAGDTHGLAAMGEKGALAIIAATHAGMTTEAFAKSVADWLAMARHPTKKVPYEQLVYKPQLELLRHLRANGFKTFIVSGGGVEFIRVFGERAYGIPPEQIVGSAGATVYRVAADGKPELLKGPKVEFVNDGPGKPVGINRFIGRRPILAFGNSDGDREMLEYVAAGDGPRLALLLHHTDAVREWAYDRASHVGKLDKALDEGLAKGWLVVDMTSDWKTVFPVAS